MFLEVFRPLSWLQEQTSTLHIKEVITKMATKLYVGNIPYGITNEQLSEIFSQAGSVVSATIITDRTSGRSKGFGFVEMETPEAAEQAIKLFHGKPYEGRNLVVNEARPRQES